MGIKAQKFAGRSIHRLPRYKNPAGNYEWGRQVCKRIPLQRQETRPIAFCLAAEATRMILECVPMAGGVNLPERSPTDIRAMQACRFDPPLIQSQRPRPTRHAERAFQRCAIPAAEISSRSIGAVQKGHERCFRIARAPHGIIGQDKLAQALVEIRRRIRSHAHIGEAVWRRIGVGIEGREIDPPPPGQKPADDTSWLYASRVTSSRSPGTPPG